MARGSEANGREPEFFWLLTEIGGNPTKTNPSAPAPDADTAATAALGPGTGSTLIPASCAARDQHAPGIGQHGRPRIRDERDGLDPLCSRAISAGRFGPLVVFVQARGRCRNRVVLKESGGPPGVFRGDELTPRAAPAAPGA